MALDRCDDDVRESIDRAAPTHPSVIDTEHLVAQLYHVVNVATMNGIDEQGRIFRPHDSHLGADIFTAFHGKLGEPYLDMLRAWVRTGEGARPSDKVDSLRIEPDAASQLARAERALGWWLHGHQRGEAAERHFVRADELAPSDWTIRRCSMPIPGKDPFGPVSFALAVDGKPDYPIYSLTPTRKA